MLTVRSRTIVHLGLPEHIHFMIPELVCSQHVRLRLIPCLSVNRVNGQCIVGVGYALALKTLWLFVCLFRWSNGENRCPRHGLWSIQRNGCIVPVLPSSSSFCDVNAQAAVGNSGCQPHLESLRSIEGNAAIPYCATLRIPLKWYHRGMRRVSY